MTRPYDSLTPDCVVDCLESIGVVSDLRLLALNSYENRVYQVGIEGADPVILKFYRAERWTDAQILEEHARNPGGVRRILLDYYFVSEEDKIEQKKPHTGDGG